MEYWAILLLALSVSAFLFGVDTITNSVRILSLILALFFLLLAGLAWMKKRVGRQRNGDIDTGDDFPPCPPRETLK